jgi:hypothetical protein
LQVLLKKIFKECTPSPYGMDPDPDLYQQSDPDPDPYQIGKQDLDPYQSEKQDPDPDPYQKGLDPQHWWTQVYYEFL